MFSKIVQRTVFSAGAASLAASALSSSASTKCEYINSNGKPSETPGTSQKRIFRSLRKETTLRYASDKKAPSEIDSLFPVRRSNTRRELSKLRSQEKEILTRWERDEDGWRELPARAWPAYQPKPEELEGIQSQFNDLGCEDQDGSKNKFCQDLLFHISTTLVFYNVDAEKGFAQYEKLASEGHVDSMVACGVMLVEGFGITPDPAKGIEWLRKAILKGSAQGCYELGTCLYTGIDGVVEEDPESAFALFEKAAKHDHTGGLYMMADCLIEGEGTEKSVGKAVPLLYRAAERGHRYSRQRIRELLAKKEYQ